MLTYGVGDPPLIQVNPPIVQKIDIAAAVKIDTAVVNLFLREGFDATGSFIGS
jgi:hypothetical protein